MPSNPKEIAFFDRGPMDSTKLYLSGFWAGYWYNGLIYGVGDRPRARHLRAQAERVPLAERDRRGEADSRRLAERAEPAALHLPAELRRAARVSGSARAQQRSRRRSDLRRARRARQGGIGEGGRPAHGSHPARNDAGCATRSRRPTRPRFARSRRRCASWRTRSASIQRGERVPCELGSVSRSTTIENGLSAGMQRGNRDFVGFSKASVCPLVSVQSVCVVCSSHGSSLAGQRPTAGMMLSRQSPCRIAGATTVPRSSIERITFSCGTGPTVICARKRS